MDNIYISSCCEDGGIYRYGIIKDGLVLLDKYDISRPKYSVIFKDKLYVICQRAYDDCAVSGLISFDIASDGSLTSKSGILPTGGVGACHLDVNDDALYVAHYYSGSVSKITGFGGSDVRIKTVTHTGSSCDIFRQRHPYCHFVHTLYDENVAVCDLGTDKVVLYDRDLNFLGDCDMPSGTGPRHFVSADGRTLWVLSEMGSTLTRVVYENGALSAHETIECYPERKRELGATKAAAVRMSGGGRFVYVSNRGFDVITVIDVSGERARVIADVSSGGGSPRDFEITSDGRYLVAANEATGVSLFSLETPIPKLIYTEALDHPISVACR